MEFKEGVVVVCSTGQAGTVIGVSGRELMVFLANADIWMGKDGECHIPTPENLAIAPLNVDRYEGRDRLKPIKRSRED